MNQKNPAENEFALAPINTQDILITERGIDFSNFAGLWTVANMILRAKMAPEGLNTPHAIALVMARGRSVGLDPFQAMESMAIVNGRVMILGDAPLAIARQHPQWKEAGFKEYFEQDGKRINGTPTKWEDSTCAVCETQRAEGFSLPYSTEPKISKFSVMDAKTAKLWGKAGPWTFYPQRMLMFRARGYALRDNFGDALKGLAIRETFDEEVDGKPTVSNVDELRESMDKRKKPSKQECVIQPTITDLSELDQARDWLKTLWEKMPIKWDKAKALKEASREEGDWIAFEHIENISDLEYLNRIAARLEEALSQINQPGFTSNAVDLEAHTKEQVERNKAKA